MPGLRLASTWLLALAVVFASTACNWLLGNDEGYLATGGSSNAGSAGWDAGGNEQDTGGSPGQSADGSTAGSAVGGATGGAQGLQQGGSSSASAGRDASGGSNSSAGAAPTDGGHSTQGGGAHNAAAGATSEVGGTGGLDQTGGRTGTGGTVGTGGEPPGSGGTLGAAGQPADQGGGHDGATGGTTGEVGGTGGPVQTGGQTGTGGAIGTGGANGTGGAVGTGGELPGTGGTSVTGGGSATGGATGGTTSGHGGGGSLAELAGNAGAAGSAPHAGSGGGGGVVDPGRAGSAGTAGGPSAMAGSAGAAPTAGAAGAPAVCDGCWIEGDCRDPEAVNPDNPCEWCQPSLAPDAWSDRDSAPCDDEVFCNGTDSCLGGSCSEHSGDPCLPDDTCNPETNKCCGESTYRICDANGDAVEYDSCDTNLGVVDDCPDANGLCADGQCLCQDGWAGDGCQTCVYYVNQKTGYDAATGRSWAQAYATLGHALSASIPSACEIWVAEGTYYPGSTRDSTLTLLPNSKLIGGFGGVETNKDQRDIPNHPTVLSGDVGVPDDTTDNAYHVVTGADGALLDGFVVTGGNANGTGDAARGGGLLVLNGSMTVQNCEFSGNAASEGSAIFGDALSNLSLYNTRIAQNGGTAVYWNGTMDATDCTVSHESRGIDAVDLVAEGCTFENCSTAIYTQRTAGWSSMAHLSITDSDLYDNGTAIDGIMSHTIVETCEFARNALAIYSKGAYTTITASAFQDNGTALHGLAGADVQITQSTFTGQTVKGIAVETLGGETGPGHRR